MHLYQENDYRIILKNLTEERKKIDASVNFQNMAVAAGCPKSYLSKVLSGHANLSTDQLFLACSYLDLSEKQKRFMLLLLEHERTSIKERQTLLVSEIELLKKELAESREHLAASKKQSDYDVYYYNPINQLVHVCLFIEQFQLQPMLIAPVLKLSPNKIISALDTLENIGLIERQGAKTIAKEAHLHLTSKSPVYETWRNELKLLTMARLNNNFDDKDYSLSVIFSADKVVQEKIRQLFLAFLKQTEELVKQAPSESVYQLSFDLFEWTKP